jgi:hypothetical protein
VEQIEFKNDGNTRMTTTKAHDNINRLHWINSDSSSGARSGSIYQQRQPANRRKPPGGTLAGVSVEQTYDANLLKSTVA